MSWSFSNWPFAISWSTPGQRLTGIAKIVDDGKLRPFIQVVLPLTRAKAALELSRSRHARWKIVLAT
ncbi:MAG: Zinc-binding dehydrogenase [Verrucomicrobiota bacterium]|jgi:NADPH:quinone reductase-like Zn-dependent oxidoreductase